MNTLDSLISEIIKLLKTEQKLNAIKPMLEQYYGSDWKNHVEFGCTYNKKKIYSDENIDVIIISWKKGQCSKIHDHPRNGCIVRILDGELEEETYKLTDCGLEFVNKNHLVTNSISYREDRTILHRITALHDCVSLHVYSPSNFKMSLYEY